MRYFTAILALAMLLGLAACGDKPETLAPTETMLSLSEKPIPAGAVLFVDENDKRKGWQWYDSAGMLVATVYEVTSQSEMDTAMLNHATGDTILLQVSNVKIISDNGNPGEISETLNATLIGDCTCGRPIINLINESDYARILEVGATWDPVTLRGIFIGSLGTVTSPMLHLGGGKKILLDDVLLEAGADNPELQFRGQTSTGEAEFKDVDDVETISFSFSDIELTINGVTWGDLDNDPCNPPFSPGVNSDPTFVWQKWGEYLGDSYDIVSPGSIANHTLISVDGASCKASIKYQYDDGATDNTSLLDLSQGLYGDSDCTSSKNSTLTGGWYYYSFNTNSYGDCDWHHGAKVTLCDSNDDVPVTTVTGTCYIAQGGIEYSCGICN